MKYHMCIDIAGALRNKAFKGYKDDDGKPMSPAAVRDTFKIMLLKGHRVQRMDGCDNFDNQKGCLGHPDRPEELQADATASQQAE